MFNIKEMRERAGMTQQEVADTLGVKKGRYGDWERETREINLRDACRLADLFGCTLDELAGHEVKPDYEWGEIEDIYASLNAVGRDKLVEYADDLASNPRNTQKNSRRDTSSA